MPSITDKGIYRTANVMIKQHADGAWFWANTRQGKQLRALIERFNSSDDIVRPANMQRKVLVGKEVRAR